MANAAFDNDCTAEHTGTADTGASAHTTIRSDATAIPARAIHHNRRR